MLTSRHALNMELRDWDAVPYETCSFLQALREREGEDREQGDFWKVAKMSANA